MKKLISIIGPMFNEEETIQKYCQVVSQIMETLSSFYDYEIVLVNDGSKDRTYNYMLEERERKPYNITIVNLTRNFGLEGAVKAGLTVAKGDAVVVMDGDLQDPPSLILEMIKKWEDGNDVVIASRKKRSHDTVFKKATARIFYKIMDYLSGKLKLEHDAANFRLLSRKALNKLLDLPEVNSVFRVTVPYIGMKTAVVEYEREERFAGSTKYSLNNMIPYALNSITGISVEPLRKIVWLSGLTGIIFISCLTGTFFTTNELWRLGMIIVSLMMFMFMILFSAISVMAEYIAQIMIEVKGRPVSIIYDYIPSKIAEERKVK